MSVSVTVKPVDKPDLKHWRSGGTLASKNYKWNIWIAVGRHTDYGWSTKCLVWGAEVFFLFFFSPCIRKSKFQKDTNGAKKTLGVVTAFICLWRERGSPFTAHRRAFHFASFCGIEMQLSADLKHNIGHRLQGTWSSMLSCCANSPNGSFIINSGAWVVAGADGAAEGWRTTPGF